MPCLASLQLYPSRRQLRRNLSPRSNGSTIIYGTAWDTDTITSWTSHTMQILVEFGSAGASPQIGEIWPFCDFSDCPVLFFSILHTGQTVGPIFALHSSNDVYPRPQPHINLYMQFDGWLSLDLCIIWCNKGSFFVLQYYRPKTMDRHLHCTLECTAPHLCFCTSTTACCNNSLLLNFNRSSRVLLSCSIMMNIHWLMFRVIRCCWTCSKSEG